MISPDVTFLDRRLPVEFWRHVERRKDCWVWHGPAQYRHCGMRRTPWVVAYEVFFEVHPPRGPRSVAQCGTEECVNPEHRRARAARNTRNHIDLSDWLPATRRLTDRRADAWARSIAACMLLALLQQDAAWARSREEVRDMVAA